MRNHSNPEVRSNAGSDLLVLRKPNGAAGPYSRSLPAADGTIIPARTGTARLVPCLLEGLAKQPEDYEPDNPQGRFAPHFLGVDSAPAPRRTQRNYGLWRLAMLQKAKDYIEVHLGDLDLTPDRIAAAQNLSTRTLHRLFESDGFTISGWIRMRRLEHCRVELEGAGSEDVPVSSIGARWGLWDAAHFSRLFKSSYGLSPRAYRATHHDHRCVTTAPLGSASFECETA